MSWQSAYTQTMSGTNNAQHKPLAKDGMSESALSGTDPGLVLPAGVTKEQIDQAVRRSGYPLQTVVNHKLRALEGIRAQSEWGFLDRTTGEMRALDLLAVADLSDDDPNRYRVRPAVAALIECKRSDLPYVFFAEPDPPCGHFPQIAGLKSDTIELKTDDDRSTWSLPILHTFGLDRHEFVRSAKSCTTFSKCERKGKDIVLSGSDSYQSIVLPLRSAVDHYKTTITPAHTPYYYDTQLVVAVAVLDAPMLSVSIDDAGDCKIENVSWQRLWRNEPVVEARLAGEHGETSAIDIVHVDFFQDYLMNHLLPFGKNFAELAHSHAEELASGKAFAREMGKDSYNDLANRMEPRGVTLRPPGAVVSKNLRSLGKDLVGDIANLARSNRDLRNRQNRP